MNRSKRYRFILLIMALLLFSACNSSSSSSGSTETTGTLYIGITDAASEDYQAVYVTISEVQVNKGNDEDGTWEVVASPNATYNLLELVNGMIETLGVANLESGLYTQMRLIIGTEAEDELNILGQPHPYANYIIDPGNESHELKIPSGYNTGIKLVHEFTIVAGRTAELVLDFDAHKSVVRAGSSGKWLLKPTIKIIGTVENASVSGIVQDEEGAPIEGVIVSSQIYDGIVSIQGSTLTDENGGYLIYLEPGSYSIVAYADGYAPQCARLEAQYNQDHLQDFTLIATTTGTITNTVTAAEGSIISIQFLQTSPCEAGEMIEIETLNVAMPDDAEDPVDTVTEDFAADLSGGTYTVVASDGITTLTRENVLSDTSVTLDFTTP